MLAKTPKGNNAQTKKDKDDEFVEHLLRDPEARSQIQEMIRNRVHQKIPALGGRTPSRAMGDSDGREIVEWIGNARPTKARINPESARTSMPSANY